MSSLRALSGDDNEEDNDGEGECLLRSDSKATDTLGDESGFFSVTLSGDEVGERDRRWGSKSKDNPTESLEMLDVSSEFFSKSLSGERSSHFFAEAFDTLTGDSFGEQEEEAKDGERDFLLGKISRFFISASLSGDEDAEECEEDSLLTAFRALSGEEEIGDSDGDRAF